MCVDKEDAKDSEKEEKKVQKTRLLLSSWIEEPETEMLMITLDAKINMRNIYVTNVTPDIETLNEGWYISAGFTKLLMLKNVSILNLDFNDVQRLYVWHINV